MGIRPTDAVGNALTSEALAMLDYFERNPQSHGWKDEIAYVQGTGVVLDWMKKLLQAERADRREVKKPMYKFEVLHEGRVYKTTAKSVAGAINFVRFKLYGLRPLSELPPFEARRIVDAPNASGPSKLEMTKAQLAARLKRMVMSA